MLVRPALLLGAMSPTSIVSAARSADLDVASVTNFYISTLDPGARNRGLPVTTQGCPKREKRRKDPSFREPHLVPTFLLPQGLSA